MSEQTWTLPQVARETGAEYRTLHTWVRRGLIKPSRASKGTGRPAVLSAGDLAEVARLVRLRRIGLSMDGLLRAVSEPAGLLEELGKELGQSGAGE